MLNFLLFNACHYHAEPSKSWLVVKESSFDNAVEIFKDTSVNITRREKTSWWGHRSNGLSQGICGRVSQILGCKALASVASFESKAAYSAFTTCIHHRYTYFMRTIPGINEFLQPLEKVIWHKLMPALPKGQSCSDNDGILLSLPVRLSGLGIIDLSKIVDE